MESYEITQAIFEAIDRIEAPTRITGHNETLGPYGTAYFHARATWQLAILPLTIGVVAGASEDILRGMATTASATSDQLADMIIALQAYGENTDSFLQDLKMEATSYALDLAPALA